MNTYNRTEIMARAWRMYKSDRIDFNFSKCLSRSWEIQKENMQKITPVQLNKLLNSLKPICIKATKEHFRFLNSKKGKGIMKRDDLDETKEMVSNGELFLNDIVHQRRIDSKKFNFVPMKQKPFRNRIVNIENCQKINIEEYVNSNN